MKTLSATAMSLFLILNPLCTYAQGIIHGYVLDSLTMDQLKGAAITLTGTSFSTVSNMDGEFRITEIPPGEYMVQASYLGYKEKKYLVSVKSEETQTLNIELLPILTTENGMTFTEQARAQAEEINQQVRSNSIENVIAGEKLQDMPDENISVALSRLPGVSIMYKSVQPHTGQTGYTWVSDDKRIGIILPLQDDFSLEEDPVSKVMIRGMDSKYSAITIDGIRISPICAKDESVDLGSFSQTGFQNVELQETITSDEDGDATAGAVNMISGEAPYKRTLQARLSGNDNMLDKSANQYGISVNYGERYLENKLGVQINANTDKKIMSNEYQDITNISPKSNVLSYTNAIREQTGGDVLLDLMTPDGGSLEFNCILNETNTNYFESQTDTMWSFLPMRIFTSRETKQRIFLSSLGGSNHFFGLGVDWNAALSESRDDHPIYYCLNFCGSTIVHSAQWPTKPDWLEYSLNSPTKNRCGEKTAAVSIYKKYDLNDEITGQLKFGGKYRMETRAYDEYSWADNGTETGQNHFIILADSTVVAKSFSGTRFALLENADKGEILLSYFEDAPPGERDLFGKYEIPLINRDALTLWRQLNFSPYYANYKPDINSYDLSRAVLAGYVMHDLSFGEWADFITGVRLESERNSCSGYYFPYMLNDPTYLFNAIPLQTPIHHNNKTTLLPNFQMMLRPTGFLNMRMAAYETLIRPDCDFRTPKIFFTGAGGLFDDVHYLNMGNPDLKNGDAWNYEFQTQFYGDALGQFGISAFYKDINGLVQATNGIQLSGKNALTSLGIDLRSNPTAFFLPSDQSYGLYTYFNSPKPAIIWGFEIEHEASFRYLPGLLKNIVLNYNITFLRSETWALDVTNIATTTTVNVISFRKQNIADMPELLANVNLGYDIGGFSFRVCYFYEGGYPIDDDYNGYQTKENELSRLDIAVRQHILRSFYFILSANNITNSELGASYGPPSSIHRPATPWQTVQAYRTGTNFEFGMGIDL